MFEFDQFQEEVLSAYLRKKAAGELPTQLVTLKRANLRNYIRGRVSRGYDQRDKAVLKEFFNADEYTSLDESIRRFDLDKFRPLISSLRGHTTSTDDNNSKLLAWLIDFEPRPFDEWRKAYNQIENPNDNSNIGGKQGVPNTSKVEGDSVIGVERSNSQPANGVDGLDTLEEVIVPDTDNEGSKGGVTGGGSKGGVDVRTRGLEPSVQRPSKPIWIVAILIITVLVMGVLFLNGFGSKHYMYWDGQQYIATSYKEEYSGIDLVPLNRHKLNNFRKIMRPDTLDRDDEKKVWYSKIDNHVEFFAMPGFHPIRQDRSLKAATKEILDKYAGDNASPIYQ